MNIKRWIQNNLKFAQANQLTPLLPALASAAQGVYNEWDQSGEDGDPTLGFGGICQDVAEAMAGVLASHGFEASSVSAAHGDQHVFVVTALADGVYMVDISPYQYETGAGYAWKKLPDITFSPDMIEITKVSNDPNSFNDFLE